MIINWNCNLDLHPSKCRPQYLFRRLDLQNNISTGYNYRLVFYYNNKCGGVRKQHLVDIHYIMLEWGAECTVE